MQNFSYDGLLITASRAALCFQPAPGFRRDTPTEVFKFDAHAGSLCFWVELRMVCLFEFGPNIGPVFAYFFASKLPVSGPLYANADLFWNRANPIDVLIHSRLGNSDH